MTFDVARRAGVGPTGERPIHFPKVRGVVCWRSWLKEISGLAKATVRDAHGIPITASFKTGSHDQLWVNVVALMQMVIL